MLHNGVALCTPYQQLPALLQELILYAQDKAVLHILYHLFREQLVIHGPYQQMHQLQQDKVLQELRLLSVPFPETFQLQQIMPVVQAVQVF